MWQPKIFKFDSSGAFPCQTSNGDLFPMFERLGQRFRKKFAVINASPQYLVGNFAYSSMQRAHSTSVRFMRSATPLSCGVYGGVNCWTIPRSAQNFDILADLYSPPLSLRKTLTRRPVCVSAHLTYCANLSKTSDLLAIRYTTVLRDLSSINVTKNRLPLKVVDCIGPQTSLCTTSSSPVERAVVES